MLAGLADSKCGHAHLHRRQGWVDQHQQAWKTTMLLSRHDEGSRIPGLARPLDFVFAGRCACAGSVYVQSSSQRLSFASSKQFPRLPLCVVGG